MSYLMQMSRKLVGKKLHFHIGIKMHFDVDIYTIEYIQKIMHEYTRVLYALKFKCISTRKTYEMQSGTSDYYKIKNDYHAPRRGNELVLFEKGQNQSIDKKTVMNYLKLIGYKFEKTGDYMLIAANERSKSAIYFDKNICFSFLFSSNKLHFMTFDDLTVGYQDRCVKFVNALNGFYEKEYHVVE